MSPGCSTGPTRTLRTAGNGARHEQKHSSTGKTLLSLADTTRLSEHILRVSDVRGDDQEPEWLDAEGLDVRPGRIWVKQLLYGMRLSYKKPAKCVTELHSLEQQHANTHRLFIKLCWLVDKHAVSADCVVNIDETSCRLPVHQIGWGRGVQTSSAAGQHKGGHDIHGRLQHGPWLAGHAGADCASGQDRRRLAGATLAGAHSPRHVRERLGHHSQPHWTTCRTRAEKDKRGSFSGTWQASTPARPHWPPCG